MKRELFLICALSAASAAGGLRNAGAACADDLSVLGPRLTSTQSNTAIETMQTAWMLFDQAATLCEQGNDNDALNVIAQIYSLLSKGGQAQ